MSHTGRCLCGSITYEISADPIMAGVCHCKNCQRQAGSAFSTIYGIPKAAFEMKGTAKLYQDSDTDSGNTVQRYFCENCGSPIYSAISSQPETLFLKTGTLDNTDGFSPQFQVFCETKQDWVQLVEGVPAIPRGT
jgi:hypothetical protein